MTIVEVKCRVCGNLFRTSFNALTCFRCEGKKKKDEEKKKNEKKKKRKRENKLKLIRRISLLSPITIFIWALFQSLFRDISFLDGLVEVFLIIGVILLTILLIILGVLIIGVIIWIILAMDETQSSNPRQLVSYYNHSTGEIEHHHYVGGAPGGNHLIKSNLNDPHETRQHLRRLRK